MAVSLQHVLTIGGAVGAVMAVVSLTPLNAFVDGTRAVLLFFVLSGLVLGLPFFQTVVSPVGFVLKRATRLYPAYWLALAISVAVFSLTARPNLSLYAIGNYASLLTEFDAQQFNVVFWSLVQEMRLSILFPLLIVPVAFLRTRWILLTIPVLIAFGYLGEDSAGAPIIGLPATVYYACFFVIGALTAKHLASLRGVVQRSNQAGVAVCLVGLIAVYGSLPVFGVTVPVEKVVIGLASAGIMVIGMGWLPMSNLLRAPALQFLGRVSYSYFLLHVPIGVVVNGALGGASLLSAAITIAASLFAAWIAYRFVEVPGINLGHKLYRAIVDRRPDDTPDADLRDRTAIQGREAKRRMRGTSANPTRPIHADGGVCDAGRG